MPIRPKPGNGAQKNPSLTRRIFSTPPKALRNDNPVPFVGKTDHGAILSEKPFQFFRIDPIGGIVVIEREYLSVRNQYAIEFPVQSFDVERGFPHDIAKESDVL